MVESERAKQLDASPPLMADPAPPQHRGGACFSCNQGNETMTTQAAPAIDPTREQFEGYQLAFDYFNEELFNGELPRCFLNFSRGVRCFGFFAPKRWRRGEDVTHEISLNPDVCERPLRDTLGTLVHEMAHLWQEVHGEPSRNGYHNKEWGAKMDEIGLCPSSTGTPGGKRTGQTVSHYILDGGAFAYAFAKMPESIAMPWTAVPMVADEKKKKTSNKVKYTCPGCEMNVWGKAGLSVRCEECDETLVAPEADESDDD